MPPSDVLLFGWLLFFQKIRHAVQTDSQSGRVVQQSRGGGLNDACHTQSDQHTVEADNEAVVSMNPPHQLLAQLPQGHQLKEIL